MSVLLPPSRRERPKTAKFFRKMRSYVPKPLQGERRKKDLGGLALFLAILVIKILTLRKA
jgi:hypothetical protein